jgi:hypothetical protein
MGHPCRNPRGRRGRVEMNSANDRVVDLAQHEADAVGAICRRPPIRFVVRRPRGGIVGRCKSPCYWVVRHLRQLPVSRLFLQANPNLMMGERGERYGRSRVHDEPNSLVAGEESFDRRACDPGVTAQSDGLQRLNLYEFVNSAPAHGQDSRGFVYGVDAPRIGRCGRIECERRLSWRMNRRGKPGVAVGNGVSADRAGKSGAFAKGGG